MSRAENKNQIAYIVQHKNSNICSQSTAGGAFSSIAEFVIDNGGVVFGVEMTSDYKIQHTCVDKKNDLWKYRNSKYVQSNVGDTYKKVKELLIANRLVCFSGTPCQIEGLVSFLGKNYENLVLVDVVCRAVPSPGVWEKYIEMEKHKYGEFDSIRFRDKGLGYQYSTMMMKTKDQKVYRGGIESQPWLRMFFSGMIIRPSCTECRFRSRYRKSDFTIWDCFNIHSIDKSFNEDCGTTRVLVHTEKGKHIFDLIKKDFIYKEIPADIAVNGVTEMLNSPTAHKNRNSFYSDFHTMDIDNLIKKYYPRTAKVVLKKYARLILNRFGLDKTVKHILKKGWWL